MLRITSPGAMQPAPDWRGIPPWMGQLLKARGIETESDAQAFLHPAMEQLHPPLLLHDMQRAVEIIADARAQHRSAVIYGDYDVDGVSASAILYEALEQFGLKPAVYIPDRHQEGYGLNCDAVEQLAKTHQLLITVDCGIASVSEVALAKQLGMQVIVTDHHRHGEQLPPADAVLSPLLADYPFPYLCGAGVAWKLAMALLHEGALPLMELAALDTVADMVSLTGENRVIVALGLEKIAATARPGLRALMNRAGIHGSVSSDQVGFQLAPRMNACGRLSSAGIALRMLLTRDADEAESIALQMENLNQQRRDEEAHVIEEAQRQVDHMDLVSTHAIVVMGEGWNSGVVGLAAGRIAEKYACPTVALARGGDVCVGSARSAGDIDIYKALSACGDLFLRFGGHKQAAGLTIAYDRVEEFAQRLSAAVAEQTGGMPAQPEIRCDGVMTLGDVTEDTVRLLQLLEPCGVGNPPPKFLCEGAYPLTLRPVGAEGRHLKCTFRQGNDLRDGIFFGGGDWAGRTDGLLTLAFTPTLNVFRGKISAECHILGMALQAESLQKDEEREAAALFSEVLSERKTPLLSLETVDAWMRGGQGTLLLCRCLETALAMKGRYPQADFALGSAGDPRAYHTILLYGGLRNACAPFRHVVLCDGDLGEGAQDAPGTLEGEMGALPMSGAMRDLLSNCFVDMDTLRMCYRSLRSRLPRDLLDAAELFHLTPGQSAFALRVLAQIDLTAMQGNYSQVTLLPMARSSPEKSPLFRLAQQAKEETHGLYSV